MSDEASHVGASPAATATSASPTVSDPQEVRERRRQEPASRQNANEATLRPEHVLRLRLGSGANCSSIGSVVDTLFATAAAGAALFAAVVAAMKLEPLREVGAESEAASTSPIEEAPPRGEPPS